MSALNRREALLAAGAASCLLQRELTEGPYSTGSLTIGVNPSGGR